MNKGLYRHISFPKTTLHMKVLKVSYVCADYVKVRVAWFRPSGMPWTSVRLPRNLKLSREQVSAWEHTHFDTTS